MRRFVPWCAVAVLGVVTLIGGAAGVTMEETTNLNRPDAPPPAPRIVGLSMSRAAEVVGAVGGRVSWEYAFSRAPKGEVISVGQNVYWTSNRHFDVNAVASLGPWSHPFAVLAPATALPAESECSGGLQLSEDGSVGPLVCGRDGISEHVNVSAWRDYAARQAPIMALSPSASISAITKAACAPWTSTGEWAFDAFDLANAYYGWHLPESFAIALYQGIGGKSCTQLGFAGP
jgi:hypothetical protein